MTKKNITKTMTVTFHSKDFENYHIKENCEGTFTPTVVEKAPLSLDAIGYVILPAIPMMVCSKCESAFLFPKFQEFVEKAVATLLVVSSNALTPQSVRFLRLVTDSKQQEIADFIACDRSHYAKCESEKTGISLSGSKQKLLKIFYAQKLGVVREALENLGFLEGPISREKLSATLAQEIEKFPPLQELKRA